MSTRITVDQLERMKTHELADLLANVVLLLRRMPDVECSSLVQPPSRNGDEAFTSLEASQSPVITSSFTQEDLKKKTVDDLKKIANDLHIKLPAKIKKDDIISKILAHPSHGHSEQYAIQNM